MNSIGYNISNLRKQNNMSQEQIAEKLGVSRQSISKWERDDALPDLYNLKAISDIFGVSIDHLVKSKLNPTVTTEMSLSPDDINKRESLVKKANILLITAIVLYITDIFFIAVLWNDLNLSSDVMLMIFGGVVALATGIIIYQGLLRRKVKRLYPDNSKVAKEDEDDNPYFVIFGCVALIIFLFLGVFYHLWHKAWIAFPISGAISMIATFIFPWNKNESTLNSEDDVI